MKWYWIAGGTVVCGTAALFAAPVIASAAGAVGLLGLASTGTPIASLTGVALANASLAAAGGGALSAGGLGIAGGTAAIATSGAAVGGVAGAVVGRKKRKK